MNAHGNVSHTVRLGVLIVALFLAVFAVLVGVAPAARAALGEPEVGTLSPASGSPVGLLDSIADFADR
jgi:hypothetical protein